MTNCFLINKLFLWKKQHHSEAGKLEKIFSFNAINSYCLIRENKVTLTEFFSKKPPFRTFFKSSVSFVGRLSYSVYVLILQSGNGLIFHSLQITIWFLFLEFSYLIQFKEYLCQHTWTDHRDLLNIDYLRAEWKTEVSSNHFCKEHYKLVSANRCIWNIFELITLMGEPRREGNRRGDDKTVAQGMLNKVRRRKSSIRNAGETKAD